MRRFGAFILAFFLLSISARAQENERHVTFQEAAALLAENNLSLHLSRFDAAEQSALARQAAAYPNPSLTVTHEPLSRDGESTSETYFNLNQPVEWSGMRRARIQAAEWLAESAEGRFQADSLSLLFDLASAYVEASAASQTYEAVLRITDIFREADRAAEEQYESGELSGYQARRISVERARYENRLALLELESHRWQRRLAALIVPEEQGVRIVPATELSVEAPVPDLTAAIEQAQQQRTELVRTQAEVAAAQFAMTGLQKSVAPAPVLTAGYKRQSNGFNGLFLGALIDLPVFDRKQGSIQAATSRLHRAETQRLLTERQIEQEIRMTYDTYESLAWRTDALAGDLLADAEALLLAAQTSYEEGEIELVELLDASDAYYDAQMTTISLNTRLLVAYYDFMRATGHIPITQ